MCEADNFAENNKIIYKIRIRLDEAGHAAFECAIAFTDKHYSLRGIDGVVASR